MKDINRSLEKRRATAGKRMHKSDLMSEQIQRPEKTRGSRETSGQITHERQPEKECERFSLIRVLE